MKNHILTLVFIFTELREKLETIQQDRTIEHQHHLLRMRAMNAHQAGNCGHCQTLSAGKNMVHINVIESYLEISEEHQLRFLEIKAYYSIYHSVLSGTIFRNGSCSNKQLISLICPCLCYVHV